MNNHNFIPAACKLDKKRFRLICCPSCAGKGHRTKDYGGDIKTFTCYICKGKKEVYVSPAGYVSRYVGGNVLFKLGSEFQLRSKL